MKTVRKAAINLTLTVINAAMLSACGKSSDSPTTASPITEKKSLPDTIRCKQPGSNYELVLVLRDPKIPEGLMVMGLKKGSAVIFKVAGQRYSERPGVLSFMESPATDQAKEVHLDLQTRVATLTHFESDDLADGSTFDCGM